MNKKLYMQIVNQISDLIREGKLRNVIDSRQKEIFLKNLVQAEQLLEKQ